MLFFPSLPSLLAAPGHGTVNYRCKAQLIYLSSLCLRCFLTVFPCWFSRQSGFACVCRGFCVLLSFISNMLAKTHASFWLPNDSSLPVTGSTFIVFSLHIYIVCECEEKKCEYQEKGKSESIFMSRQFRIPNYFLTRSSFDVCWLRTATTSLFIEFCS